MHTCCTWCKECDVGSHGCMLSVLVDEIALVAMDDVLVAMVVLYICLCHHR